MIRRFYALKNILWATFVPLYLFALFPFKLILLILPFVHKVYLQIIHAVESSTTLDQECQMVI